MHLTPPTKTATPSCGQTLNYITLIFYYYLKYQIKFSDQKDV